MSFPEGFVWGATASSYQIEGAAFTGGKGLSVWDVMCRQPGKIWSGNSRGARQSCPPERGRRASHDIIADLDQALTPA
ncbi:MAG: family 1 glycosylhydrolase [Anaerolineales bacterium]|nr:family 1 glycosylhydrolase [Anaerolineales bacterium]